MTLVKNTVGLSINTSNICFNKAGDNESIFKAVYVTNIDKEIIT